MAEEVAPAGRIDRSGTPVIRAVGLAKKFGGVTALGGVDLEVHAGEVLALLGDNGAGKSTLIKSISGTYRPDAGHVEIDGARVDIVNPQSARAHGIETVFQDLALFDNLRPAANFYAGRETTSPRWLGALGFLRTKAMNEETARVIERLQVTRIDLGSTIGFMSGGQRQAVACARAFAFASKVVILDEPTAALGLRETANVLRLIKRLSEEGVAVILISHNLDQVSEVAHRAIIMRRGAVVGTAVPTPGNHPKIVSLIVGSLDAATSQPSH